MQIMGMRMENTIWECCLWWLGTGQCKIQIFATVLPCKKKSSAQEHTRIPMFLIAIEDLLILLMRLPPLNLENPAESLKLPKCHRFCNENPSVSHSETLARFERSILPESNGIHAPNLFV